MKNAPLNLHFKYAAFNIRWYISAGVVTKSETKC